jgi:hypothetical protein
MELEVTTPHAFTVRAAPVNPVPVNPGGAAVILVPTPGVPGANGSAEATLSATTARALSGHFVVKINDAGLMDYASANDLGDADRPLAMVTGAWSSGVSATATLFGPITEPSWSWTVGQPIWLGDNGLPTHTLPMDALFQRQVGEVINPTTIMFWAQAPIVLS